MAAPANCRNLEASKAMQSSVPNSIQAEASFLKVPERTFLHTSHTITSHGPALTTDSSRSRSCAHHCKLTNV